MQDIEATVCQNDAFALGLQFVDMPRENFNCLGFGGGHFAGSGFAVRSGYDDYAVDLGAYSGLLHETRWFSIASSVVPHWNVTKRHILAVILTCLLVFLLACLQYDRQSPHAERGILPINPATPYVRFTPDLVPTGTVILVHGLNSNKEFMQSFGMALAESGFEVYAFDLPGHGGGAP